MLRACGRLLCRASSRPTPGSIRYVASDMDGTILSAQYTLSAFTKATLFALTHEKKIPFIFATGREHADVAVINAHLQAYFRKARADRALPDGPPGSDATPLYLITSNGSVAHNATSNEMVVQQCISPALVRELYALLPAAETRVNTHLSQDDRWYCRMDWAELLRHHKESGQTYTVVGKIPPHGDSKGEVEGGPTGAAAAATVEQGSAEGVVKVFFTSWDKALLDALETELHARYDDRLNIMYSAAYCIDVTAKGTNKASALRTVLGLMPPAAAFTSSSSPSGTADDAEIEARLRQTIAFGNDLNDACMLQAAGGGYLVANSNPQLMESCPGMTVIGHHDEDGVAKQLCELFDLDV